MTPGPSALAGPAAGRARPADRGWQELGPPLLADLLRSGRGVRLEVTGHSMTPFVRRGDVVTIASYRGAPLSLGQVVAFAPAAGRLIVHRVVGRTDGCLLPRGDAAPTADPPITCDEVLGVVTRVERRGRRVGIGLGPERRAVAWLSRIGLLRCVARLRARRKSWLRHGPSGTATPDD